VENLALPTFQGRGRMRSRIFFFPSAMLFEQVTGKDLTLECEFCSDTQIGFLDIFQSRGSWQRSATHDT